jgi:hypothetical protein
MKKLNLILSSLLLVSGAFLSEGCKKDVDEVGQTSTTTLSTQGGIKFKVKDTAGNLVPNAKIGLAVSQSDLVTNTYLASKFTNSYGEADLGRFNGGNYYYEIDVTIDGTAHHGDGAVQIRNGEDITQNLVAE